MSLLYNPMAFIGTHIGLRAIVVGASLTLGCLSVFRPVKLGGDPSRSGFIWLHPAIWSLFISSTLTVAGTSYVLGLDTSDPELDFTTAQEHSARMGAASTIFEVLAHVFFLFSLSGVILGAKAVPKEASRAYRYPVATALGLATALALAVFAYGLHLPVVPLEMRHVARIFLALRLAGSILVMLVSWAVLAQAVSARKVGVPAVGKVVVAAGIAAAVMTWTFLATLLYQSGRWPGLRRIDTTAVTIADDILGGWGVVAAMVVLYLAGRQREGGLWSGKGAAGKVERVSEEGVMA